MSDSIWKTREEKPKGFILILEYYKSYDFDNNKDINTYDVFETSGNPQNPFDGSTIRWCYLDDLITKAERLQKAVDLTIDYLEQVATHAKTEEDNFAVQVIKRKIDEIKQLIKD